MFEVELDVRALAAQAHFKNIFLNLEEDIDSQLISPHSKAKALIKLEDAYMWVVNAILNDQLSRNTAVREIET